MKFLVSWSLPQATYRPVIEDAELAPILTRMYGQTG
jgi:hypothetical protein